MNQSPSGGGTYSLRSGVTIYPSQDHAIGQILVTAQAENRLMKIA